MLSYTLKGMIEIGRTKVVAVRCLKKDADGKRRVCAVTDEEGQTVTKVVMDEVWRQTRGTLGGTFGPDKHRKLVVGLVGVDQLVLSPKGTRQEYRVNLKDVFAWVVRSRAARAQLERARERKEKLKARREQRRIEAADRRIHALARKAFKL